MAGAWTIMSGATSNVNKGTAMVDTTGNARGITAHHGDGVMTEGETPSATTTHVIGSIVDQV